MANGMAPNFNDRRGQNPFQRVIPSNMQPQSMAAQRAKHPGINVLGAVSYHSIHSFGGDSYLGQGVALPNGALPPRVINGRTYTRDNPDVVGLRRRQLEIGERSAL